MRKDLFDDNNNNDNNVKNNNGNNGQNDGHSSKVDISRNPFFSYSDKNKNKDQGKGPGSNIKKSYIESTRDRGEMNISTFLVC